MVRFEKKLGDLIVNYIKVINKDQPIEQKLPELLVYIGKFFRFRRGFIYQTDGFRFFYLKETFGNEDNVLQGRILINNLKHRDTLPEVLPFYICLDENTTPAGHQIFNFFSTQSLWLNKIVDTEGKTIGYIGFTDKENPDHFEKDELQAIWYATDLLTKEIIIREYKEREIRAGKTLENIMNHMGVDIYVNSFETHEMLYANETMAAPYGGFENFKGKKCWQALYKDKTGECEFCPKYHLIDENGQPTKVYSWDYQRPFDKSWFRVFSAAFNWIDGQLAHVVTSVDITNQKNIEEQLVQAKEKAENMDRLKSTFLANMSHEIRTPLNAIVGFSGLMEKEDNPEKRKRYNRIVQESNQLLLQLITDILDFSRIEAGILDFTIGNLNVRELCDEIVCSYQVKETKGIPIIFDLNLPEYYIRSDKKRLTQVITNLINNALKFTTSGKITLGYRLLDNIWIEFRVSDTGVGIAPDKVEQVFERFTKLNPFDKGTGLGLSICKSIIEQLGGNMGVVSEVDVGSQFWFTLPYQ